VLGLVARRLPLCALGPSVTCGIAFALGGLAALFLVFVAAIAAAWWIADTVCGWIERGRE